jgi:hypothetical protein
MKHKSSLCSTGHGTGLAMPVPAGVILMRDRYRLRRKQVLRREKAQARAEFHKGAGSNAPSCDMVGFWQVALKRQFGAPLGKKGEAAAARAARSKKPGLLRRAAKALGLAR